MKGELVDYYPRENEYILTGIVVVFDEKDVIEEWVESVARFIGGGKVREVAHLFRLKDGKVVAVPIR